MLLSEILNFKPAKKPYSLLSSKLIQVHIDVLVRGAHHTFLHFFYWNPDFAVIIFRIFTSRRIHLNIIISRQLICLA